MKQTKILKLSLAIWIFGWSYLCIEQVKLSVDHINTKTENISSVVVIETEKEVSEIKADTEHSTVKEDCNAEAFWKDNIEINFNENYSEVSLEFKNMKPNAIDTLFMELQFVPVTDNYRNFRGFSFYNF